MDSGEPGVQIYVDDERCACVLVAERLLNRLGYAHAALAHRLGSGLWEMVHPEDRAQMEQMRQKQLAQTDSFSVSYRLRADDGSYIWVDDRGQLEQREGSGHPCRQLTELSGVRKPDSYYRMLFDALPTPTMIVDTGRRVLFVNRAIRESDDFPASCLEGSVCDELQTSGCGTAQCCVQAFLRGEVDVVQTFQNGKSFQMKVSPFYDGQQKPAGYIKVFTDVTGQLATDRELRLSQQRYLLALAQTRHVIWEYDIKNRTAYQADRNDGTLRFVAANVPESLIEAGMILSESAEQVRKMYADIHAGCEKTSCLVHMRGPDKEESWVQFSNITIFDQQGAPARAIGVAQDVTAEQERTERLEQGRRIRESLVADALYAFEVNLTRDRVSILNGGEHLGDPSGGWSYSDLFALTQSRDVHPEDREQVERQLSREELLQAFARGQNEARCEYRRRDANRRMIWVCETVYLSASEGSGEVVAFSYVRDIDQSKKQEAELQLKAERDPLTGTYNRVATNAQIDRLLAVREKHTLAAMFMLDIDNFKTINDTYGHLFGDAVLTEISARLHAVFRPADIVGRLGGDEFVVFVPRLSTREAAGNLADRICAAAHSSFSTGSQKCEISTSVGIAFAPEDGTDFRSLYERADAALYQAKNRGKNGWTFYEDGFMQNADHTPVSREQERSGGSFTEDMGEYLFEILCRTETLTRSIDGTLELIGGRYEATRVFVIDYQKGRDEYSMSYEWCAAGTAPAIDWMQRIPGRELDDYRKVFAGQKLHAMDEWNRDALGAKLIGRLGGCAALHCAIYTDDGLRGFLGVNWTQPRPHSARDQEDLCTAVGALGRFLYKRQGKQPGTGAGPLPPLRERLPLEAKGVAYGCVYVIDPESRTFLYCNHALRERFPGAVVGESCYRTLRGLDRPCVDCPMDEMRARRLDAIERRSMEMPGDTQILLSARWISWPDGRRCCLIDGCLFR